MYLKVSLYYPINKTDVVFVRNRKYIHVCVHIVYLKWCTRRWWMQSLTIHVSWFLNVFFMWHSLLLVTMYMGLRVLSKSLQNAWYMFASYTYVIQVTISFDKMCQWVKFCMHQIIRYIFVVSLSWNIVHYQKELASGDHTPSFNFVSRIPHFTRILRPTSAQYCCLNFTFCCIVPN